jgi:hypothetical protein
MLERIAAILAPGERAALAAASTRARAVALPTPAMMAERTMAIYRRSLRPGTVVAHAPITAVRCLAALDYAPWPTPAPSADLPAATAMTVAAPAVRDAFGRVASFALHVRHTLPGRVLYRLAPKSLLAALKSHL